MTRAGVLLAALTVGTLAAGAVGCREGTAYSFPPASARPEPTASGSAAWAVQPPPDPAVMKLANDVTSTCPFDEGSFRGDCPALRKWTNPKANPFQGRRADATVLDLLGSTDEKMRVLAAQRPYWDEATILGSKAAAEKLASFAERAEANPRVRARLLDDVLKVDFGALGMMDRLKQFVARADATVRQEIPAKFLHQPKPVSGALELVGSLLADPEEAVRRAAFRELMSAAGDESKRVAVCKIVTDAMDPTLELTDEIMTSFASASGCPDAPPKFVDRITEAMKKPAAISENTSRLYPNVLRGICTKGTSYPEADATTKKRAFDAAKSIAKTKSFDVYGVRATAIDALVACDPAAAPAVLQKLMQDPDPSVDQLAKDAYDRLTGAYYSEY